MIIERAIRLKCDYIDSITTYCEENEMEVELAAKMIDENLKSLLANEASSMRIIPKISRLPL